MNKKNNEITVTKPFLPPEEEYKDLLGKIWKRNWLTNNGPLVQELENRLKEYLGVSYLNYVTNGTIALQLAIKALDLKGEIITTPFSYVATTSSIVWEGCTPVFVDIDPSTLNIDPDLIEDAITGATTAILATHVFGNPCDIDSIQKIANRNNLKVIYDAAHCFGVKYKGQSVYNFGNISTASFHATKLFHTVEGGAVITNDREIYDRIGYMRNFGHDGPGKFNGVGINGKNSEFHAAMGLCNLNYLDEILLCRKKQWRLYEKRLNDSDLRIRSIDINIHAEFNHAYYPVIFEEELITLEVKKALEELNIFPRRYFYPSLSNLDYTDNFKTPNSENISRCILSLPLFHSLSEEEQIKIIKCISMVRALI